MTKKVSRLLIAMLILLVTSNTALTAPGDEDEQLRRARQQEQERQQRQQSRDVFLQPKVDISQDFSLPEENPSFLVRKVVISGEDAIHFSWLQGEADRYNNRFIGKQGIDLIAKRLGKARFEINQARYFDFIVINDDLERACHDVLGIMHMQRLRCPKQLPFIDELLK